MAVDEVTGLEPPWIDISVEVNAGKENVVSDLRGNGSRMWCYKVLARFESTGNPREIKSNRPQEIEQKRTWLHFKPQNLQSLQLEHLTRQFLESVAVGY